jgi:hypothetical protein
MVHERWGLPEHTVQHVLVFMEKLRGMYEADPLAFEICVRHVASVIEDQRREEAKTDLRAGWAPDIGRRRGPIQRAHGDAQPPVGSSKDGAAWSHLKGGDAPAVEHYEPVAVPTPQHTVTFSKGRDDAVRDLVESVSRLFVGYIQVLAANEADAQHDLCHGHAP